MSLFKRGDIWWAYFYRDGIRYQYSTGTPNRKQAETIEAKLKEEVNKQRFQIVEADPQVTLNEIAAQFVASASVRPHHLFHLKFLLGFFGEMAVLRITKSMADEFRRARRATNPAIKDATVNRDLSVLRHVLYWAADEKLIPANPLARLKMAAERRTRRPVLSVAEETQLLGAATGHLRLMIILALDTGMRRGEITSQLWEDIDFDRDLLFVTHSKTAQGESREIPFTGRLLEILNQHRQPKGLLITYKNAPVRFVKRTWKTAVKNAGIRHVRFHDLRHTFNTRLLEAGVLQEIRMALMGHSPGSAVHATYTHIELPVKRDAIRKLELWKSQQELLLKQQNRKEDSHARTEERSEAATDDSKIGSQAVEKEKPGGGGSGPSRQAQSRNRRSRGRTQGQTQTTAKVRRSQEDLRERMSHGTADR